MLLVAALFVEPMDDDAAALGPADGVLKAVGLHGERPCAPQAIRRC